MLLHPPSISILPYLINLPDTFILILPKIYLIQHYVAHLLLVSPILYLITSQIKSFEHSTYIHFISAVFPISSTLLWLLF